MAKHYRTGTKVVHIEGAIGTLCGRSFSDNNTVFTETTDPATCKRCIKSDAAETTKW